MLLLLLEDEGAELLRPASDLTPVHDLVIGREKISERAERLLEPSEMAALVRPHLRPKVRDSEVPPFEGAEEDVLILNSRWVIGQTEARLLLGLDKGEALASSEGTILGVRLDRSMADQIASWELKRDMAGVTNAVHALAETVKVVQAPRIVKYPWELLKASLEALEEGPAEGGVKSPPSGVRVLGDPKRVTLSEGVEFEGPCVIDARQGPVHLGQDVVVGAHATLVGPLHIEGGSTVFPCAYISNSYIGPVCKIGGEFADSVVLGYSNKAHYGYVGHSYVGRWVNIGAGTATSDLKNTYGEIRKVVAGQRIGTGEIKLGSFIGDHAKTAIGAMLYTGLFAGAASHLHGFVLEDVPPFTIYAETLGWGKVELELESAIRTYERMAARRSVEPSRGEEESMRLLFEITRDERRRAGVEVRRVR